MLLRLPWPVALESEPPLEAEPRKHPAAPAVHHPQVQRANPYKGKDTADTDQPVTERWRLTSEQQASLPGRNWV